MAYREIVTKAVIAKGKKKYKNSYQITVDNEPTTVLGVWIINHNFKGSEDSDKIRIDGTFDANVWYSYDNDTKTSVVSKQITYTELEKINIPGNEVTNKDIIIRSLKQPTCISAKEEGRTINLDIEKELGIEIVGDTKVKISSVDEDDDTWDELDEEAKTDEEIAKKNPNYIDEEIVK